MELILCENYPSLGYVGDRVMVKRGFARNFLIPKGIAIDVSSKNSRMVRHKLAAIEAKRIALKDDAEREAQSLGAVELSFRLKIGAQGKSFGSITVRDLAGQLKEKGFEIERKQIKLAEPIKKPGEISVDVKLHSEVSVPIKVIVEGIVVKPPKEELETDKKRGGRSGKDSVKRKAERAESGFDAESAGDSENVSGADLSGRVVEVEEKGGVQEESDKEES